MKNVPKSVCLAALLSALVLPPLDPASADAPVTDGLICSFTTVIDPTAEEGTQTGQLEGGPVLFTVAPDGTTPQEGTLICRVQVVDAFASDHTGSGPSVSGRINAAGVAVAGPYVITINRTGSQNVFLCSEFVDNSEGLVYYWDDDNSEWSTNPVVHCGLSLTGDKGGAPRDSEVLVDSIICPILALVFPPEGDIPGIWDCPPYGNARRYVQRPPGGNGGGSHGGGHQPDPNPDTPVYPTGTIIISGSALGFHVSYGAFNPPRDQWTCSPPEPTLTVSCTPPTPPAGYTNVCATVSVDVTNGGDGTVSGSSHCSTAPGAYAVSFGPTATPTHDTASQNSTFPWTCEAVPNQSVPGPWEVRCAVGN